MDEEIKMPDTRCATEATTYVNLIHNKLLQLGDSERNLILSKSMYGPTALAALSAFILNSQLKRSIMLYEGVIYTSFVAVFSASMSNVLSRKMFVDYPMYEGKLLSCSTCAMMREGFLQAATGTVIPLLGSVVVNAIFCDRYNAVDIPSLTWRNKAVAWKFWISKMRTFRTPIYIAFGLHAFIGAFIGYRKREIFGRVHDSVTDEELSVLFKSDLQFMRNSR